MPTPKTPSVRLPGDLYLKFSQTSTKELERCLLNGATREEKIFYRKLLNLKLQLEQEKVIGELLLRSQNILYLPALTAQARPRFPRYFVNTKILVSV